MKILNEKIHFAALFLLVGVLGGCTNDANEETTASSSESESVLESVESISSISEMEESNTEDTNIDEIADDQEDQNALSQYSSEQIEYARVWLQLGANQDIDELYVQQIPAGTPLHPDDETSLEYPENVIQLSGSRLVDGSVTYSGNGDGTINIYRVPLRWDGNYPAGEEFYADIINHTESAYIDPGSDEEVIELIKLIKSVD